jgi:hypothetical protein
LLRASRNISHMADSDAASAIYPDHKDHRSVKL